MKTIFSLFTDYANAAQAFQELQSAGFDPGEINVILARDTARNFMEVDQNRVKAEKSQVLPVTGEHGDDEPTQAGREERSLDEYLGGEQGVRLPDLGEVYAAGKLADILTSSTAAAGGRRGGIKDALVDLSIDESAAQAYSDGIRGGGVLLFVRADDDRTPEAAGILRAHKGQHVAGYPR